MRFAVVGGDKRAAHLCSLLAGDGHKVSSFALEKAELPGEVQKAGCLHSCLYGADCVILPLPAERCGLLNAPFAAQSFAMEQLWECLWPGQFVCGGAFTEDSCSAALGCGLRLTDLMQRPDFVTANAALTAEGALELLMENSERALWESSVLVCGWGRIGKILALRLKGIGANVSLAARRASDRAMARALGCETLDYRQLEGELDRFDFIVNTVPARVLSEAMLCCVQEGALLLELASTPGGFDRTLAENIGIRTVYAPGLPGKAAPLTAAGIIRDAVYAAIREQED